MIKRNKKYNRISITRDVCYKYVVLFLYYIFMISFPDIETINKHCARLKEIIYKNKRDIDNAIYTKRKMEFIK